MLRLNTDKVIGRGQKNTKHENEPNHAIDIHLEPLVVLRLAHGHISLNGHNHNNENIDINERVLEMLDTLEQNGIGLVVPHAKHNRVGYEHTGQDQIRHRQREYGLVVHLTLEANAGRANETIAYAAGPATLFVEIYAYEEKIAGRADEEERDEYARGNEAIGVAARGFSA